MIYLMAKHLQKSVLRVITIRKKLLCRRNKLQVVPHVTNRSSATKNIGGFLILLNSFNFLRTTGEGNKVVWTHRPYFREPKCWSKTIASYLCTPVTKHPGYSQISTLPSLSRPSPSIVGIKELLQLGPYRGPPYPRSQQLDIPTITIRRVPDGESLNNIHD